MVIFVEKYKNMVVRFNGKKIRVNNFIEALETHGKKVEQGKESKFAKHIGKLKWDIDGVEYQRKIRDEWD